MKLSGRLTLVLLAAALVPLLVAGSWSLVTLQKAENWSLAALERANDLAIDRSEHALNALGEDRIEQKARDVARQIELYLGAHPEIDLADLARLEQNAELARIAVQPIGETGYTAVFDSQGITHFHANPQMIGVNIGTLAADYPAFWQVYEPALDGTPSNGYYDWPESDGSVRPKYASIVPVGDTPLRVAATTYIDEFSQPVGVIRSELAIVRSATAAQLAGIQRTAWRQLLVVLVVSLLAVAGGAFLFSRRICQPVVEMADAAAQIADGDLSVRPPATRMGELGLLSDAFGRMSTNLGAIVRQMRSVGVSLSGAAAQVMRTQQRHSGDSQKQVSAMTNASAAVEELAASSTYIADTAQKVFEAASQTESSARRGTEAMAATSRRLERISAGNETAVAQVQHLGDLAGEIGSVVDLVEEVAAQTRMIAFNASIEAAAAGEVGRRFAVVAGEVRSLASDVAHSAEDIRFKVEQIQATTNGLIVASEQECAEIDAGITAGEGVLELLNEILDSAEQTTVAGQQISFSTRQQHSATEQLLEDLQSLTIGAQAVAASSTETVEVMHNLLSMAQELNLVVDRFRLPGQPADPAGPAESAVQVPEEKAEDAIAVA